MQLIYETLKCTCVKFGIIQCMSTVEVIKLKKHNHKC